jgi:hypothetical protein
VATGSPVDLGTRTISGYTVKGERKTYSYSDPARQPQPVQVTQDIWFSPDLQVALLIETSDTLGNSTTKSLKEITLGEPAPSLFTIPPAYMKVNANTPPAKSLTAQTVTTPRLSVGARPANEIPLTVLYQQFFLYEAHLEHLAAAHPEVPKGRAVKDYMRNNIGLSEEEWKQIAASSQRIEKANQEHGVQRDLLIAEDRKACQSNPPSCASATPNLSALRNLQSQRNREVVAEFEALESALGPDSTAKLRAYLQGHIASHINMFTRDAVKSASTATQEVSK